jgi:MFS family permease
MWRPKAFSDRNFGRYVSARFASSMATHMQATAVGWQIYDLTGDPIALGLIGLAQFAPAMPLMPISGQVADRFDRRVVLGCCYVVSIATMAILLAVSYIGGVWPIYAAMAIYGATRAFEAPANQALLPGLVPLSRIKNAIAVGASTNQTATILGPAAGGFLYVLGPEAVYGTAILILTVGLALIAQVRLVARPRPWTAKDRSSTWGGVVFIWRRKEILGAIGLDLFAVIFASATALLPIFAKDVLDVGPWGLGLLRSAPAVGAIAIGVVLAHRPIDRRIGQAFLIAVAVYGLAATGFGASDTFALSLTALAVLGAADQISVILRGSLIQISTPDELRGRVAAANAMVISASNQIGRLQAGFVAAWIGAVPTVVLGGLATVAIVGLWAAMFPALRQVDRL